MSGGSLTVHDLAVHYGRAVRPLRRVSLEVAQGGVAAVLGANGAGKSTLLRAISGTLRFHRGGIDSGRITFGGQRLDGLDPAAIVRRGIVQVPEGRRVFARMTVEENLQAGGLSGVGRGELRRIRTRVLELFPVLGERAGQRAGLLSGGEQQMLAIGRALMARPKVLLLDEPTLGLAPQIAARIAATIGEINRQGISVLLVEQNAALALRMADDGYVLDVGEVVLSGPADELAASDEVRRRYLGVSEEGLEEDEAVAGLSAARGRTLSRWAS
ncbi:branched-chain amino acid transport system ATP-binding protein [Spinactinospora alkalitolerans]|uniref:Branched-chain amino acid transport system ATP-binding protein n=1 Tax=Spinactinospora alkalitolerans TaxID=687207 RepID=A0A852TXJ8_9ACTN|nr:ABC transporter ATP-binding protein [Spinactinospora alkalitolerans]NYE48085.1 branched-chain amino acid transport system ATP-binding protein [Spinactinospora alkalitolerans]